MGCRAHPGPSGRSSRGSLALLPTDPPVGRVQRGWQPALPRTASRRAPGRSAHDFHSRVRATRRRLGLAAQTSSGGRGCGPHRVGAKTEERAPGAGGGGRAVRTQGRPSGSGQESHPHSGFDSLRIEVGAPALEKRRRSHLNMRRGAFAAKNKKPNKQNPEMRSKKITLALAWWFSRLERRPHTRRSWV